MGPFKVLRKFLARGKPPAAEGNVIPSSFFLYPCWLLETDKSGSVHKMQGNQSRHRNVSKDLSRDRYGLFPATLYHKLYLFTIHSPPWGRFWMLAFLPFLWACIAQTSSDCYLSLQCPVWSVIFFLDKILTLNSWWYEERQVYFLFLGWIIKMLF